MTEILSSGPHDEASATRMAAARPAWQAGRARLRALAQVRWLWQPLLLFTVTRVGIALVAYLAPILMVASPDPPPYHLRGTDNLLLDVFASRWDTGFYVSIAEEGYVYEADPFPSVPFFPLLPLLMRALAPLTGDVAVAGLLVTNVALLLAAILLYRLVLLEDDHAVAGRAVWYVLIFPTAFFGSALYSESLFLLGAIGALYAARRGRWWLAGLLGLVTALSRLVGLIVAPLLLLEWLSQRREAPPGSRPAWPTLLAPGLAPLGTLGYMAYLWLRFDDPLGFVSGSAAWARVPQSPLTTIGHLLQAPEGGWTAALLAGHIHVNDWFDLLALLLFFGLGLVLLARRRWSEGAFVTLGVLFTFSSGLLMSQRRYVWVLFPAFILLARWGQRAWVDRLVTTLSLLLLALFTALFANGYWVG